MRMKSLLNIREFTMLSYINSVINHTNSAVTFTDSLALNNKMHNNIYTFSHALNTSKYYLTDLYYTPAQGMVGYHISDGSTYSLVELLTNDAH
jgi:hypothetical protein